MDLETTFYTLGIIYMVMMMLATAVFIGYSIYLVKKFEHFQQDVEQRVKNIITPTSIMGVGGLLFKSMVSWIRSKRR